MLCTLLAVVVNAEETRPNILFAISDDQSWMHAGAYGLDRSIQTPAFDRVAREGVLLALRGLQVGTSGRPLRDKRSKTIEKKVPQDSETLEESSFGTA